jgi:ABC-type polysaccharide/polyol phosphate transport system ATPase subunit
MNPVEFNHVWKKFKRGEKFNSLRDAIPNFVKGMISKKTSDEKLETSEFWAVKDVSFSVKKGEVVGFIGPNGAGKSTILKLLSRIMDPYKGDMSINGRLSALIEVTAGFHPELTGRENVYLNGTILGMKRKELDEKFDAIVEFSGLKEFIDTPVKRYSSGMFSRLGFSVAAHVDPDILLVDEVLSVGDIAFQAKCAQKMREMLQSGVTIILVSHNLQLVQSLCSRVLLLNKGQILKEGPPHEVIPYYENIIFQDAEMEFQNKISKYNYKVKVKAETAVEVTNVTFKTKRTDDAKDILPDDELSIHIDYCARQQIENPIFAVEILRSDGVLCSCFNTTDFDYRIKSIHGHGTVHVDLGRINYAPGLYLVKIGIWDQDILHPYIIREQDIFKVHVNGQYRHTGAIMVNSAQWTMESTD